MFNRCLIIYNGFVEDMYYRDSMDLY